jgi:2'-5' RNA ligase
MFDQPTAFTDRLFFAIFPDAGTAARIARLRQELVVRLGLKGKPVSTGRLHATLHHVADYAEPLPQDIVAVACEAADTVRMPPFIVAFNSVESFRGRPGNQPLVMRGDDGVAGLMMLQQRPGSAMEKAGLGRCVRHYTPHVTLLRGSRLVGDPDVRVTSWSVHEFVLVHSLLGRSSYRMLTRFPAQRSGVSA